MKKISIMLSAVAAAFAFSGCAEKYQTVRDASESFTLHAELSDTKTANDGMSTVWVKNDALSVFHADAGENEYVSDGKFIVDADDPASGVFSGAVSGSLDGNAAYDWYAIYPYASNRTTPASQSIAVSAIGSSIAQTQTKYGDMSHISEGKSPLYGVVKNVSGTDLPSMRMNYLASLVRIKVVNRSGKTITVTSAEFTAPEQIVGSFFIDFAAEEPVYKAKSTAAAKSTAVLSVTGNEELPSGSTADLYMLVKPFVAEQGEDLVLKVNNLKKTLTMTKDVKFSAGKIKTLEFVINEGEIKEPSEYDTPDGKQWFFTMYTGGFQDEAHRTVGVIDLGVVTAGKCTCAVQSPDVSGRIMWGSIFNIVELDYEITPFDDASGIITLPEIGFTFSYSGLAEKTMILDDEWGVYGEEGTSYDCESGLYNVTSYFNQYGGM